ncbi:MAG: hypothetical protein JWO45_183 [Spartobacteria bacterium]|nr:hypothetical protein [Spartobacteria bacterium]
MLRWRFAASVRNLLSCIGAASQTILLEPAGLKSNIICGVHGSPSCSAILPVPSNREPTGAAFVTAAIFAGSAQPAKPSTVTKIADALKIVFIEFIFLLFFREFFTIPGKLSLDLFAALPPDDHGSAVAR